MPSYRAAIVGTGGIAAGHVEALRAHADRVELVAITDVDADRATAFARDWTVPAVYNDLASLLEAQKPDLVHLCTPPSTHAPLAEQCLRAGVNVLVEKPPTLSLAELDTLAAVSGETGAQMATVFQHRFGAGAIRLRNLMASGELGRSLLASCHTLWYRDDDYYQVPWRGRWETEGGGPTMGHGIHQFDLLLSILGPWQRVIAMTARRARPVQTEDVSTALVEFADGTLATVVNSVVSPRQVSALRFDFEHATVELDHLYGYTDDDWTITAAPGHEELARRWPAASTPARSGHADQIAALLDTLDAGQPLPVGLAETRQTMEFIAALYASAATGAPVQRGEITPDHPFAAHMNGHR
ncbi:putative dehydrogenase [Actinoplanes lutulentus]|uniref:Putative dehydrogenase n=1 Tax=Actinoplanes lutulentus TaxID=1287878 RepID=A0A327ZIT7_9ACTN|nr:Gfo/Idh/MocA family oxidoreductase [Actinoplanes lutulentus]MBB2947323.1 putative dehydrogenase [Actinoplanes lutulentus]RAK36598.1 putative dehydrogenase [Actinoplanes lutulentus]